METEESEGGALGLPQWGAKSEDWEQDTTLTVEQCRGLRAETPRPLLARTPRKGYAIRGEFPHMRRQGVKMRKTAQTSRRKKTQDMIWNGCRGSNQRLALGTQCGTFRLTFLSTPSGELWLGS